MGELSDSQMSERVVNLQYFLRWMGTILLTEWKDLWVVMTQGAMVKQRVRLIGADVLVQAREQGLKLSHGVVI